MAWPVDPITTPDFVDFSVSGVPIDATTMDAKIAARLNALRNAIGFGLVDEYASSAGTVLNNTSQKAGQSSVTWTVPASGRTYKLTATAVFTMASGTGPGVFNVQAMYCSGPTASIGSATGVGYKIPTILQTAAGSEGQEAIVTVTLPAGQYTAFPGVQRSGGGTTSDSAASDRILVEDVGA